MKPLIELLEELRAKGVKLALEGEALKCTAPAGVLNAELKGELAQRKPEIVAFLKASQKPSHVPEPLLARIDRSRSLPLSYSQQRLWFLNQLDPESTVYNIGGAVRLRGDLNIPALEKALKEIIRRHESLRTSFEQISGEPQIRIHDNVEWSLNVIDAGHLTEGQDDSGLRQYASSLIRERLDFAHAPLFRAWLLVAGQDTHILVLTVHHIVFDGWSIGLFGQELSELYRAYCEQTEPALPPLSLQYVDFAAWQRKWLEAGELERQLGYWKKQLAGSPPLITFPPDRKRQPGLSRGGREKLTIPRELVAALETLSQERGATLFMVLLAAFKVLLARYTGQDDIVIGSPSAGRTRSELYPIIGFFVNNLVLRSQVNGDLRFSDLLQRVRDVTLRANEHQDLPFDQLVQAMHPERSLDHSPLFQTMFALQNFPMQDLKMAGVTGEPFELDGSVARFDLTVEVYPRDGELIASFDYNADLYDADTISRIQNHYLAILTAIIADPNVKVAEIPLLTAAEREKLLVEWNRTQAAIPEELCFYQQFEKHAAATPNRVAVIAGGVTMTYGQLNQRANRIADVLRALGAGPEKLVAICEERGIDLIAAMLGVVKSGAAYVPLDPTYPKGRIETILEDARPTAILTSSKLLDSLPDSGGRAICLDTLESGGAPKSEQPHNTTGLDQNSLAYVIFTSGSTGKPKGVQITHRALLNFLEAMQNQLQFTTNEVLLAVTTVSFDIAGLELLLPLYTGATVCVALQPGNPEVLLADLASYRPTVMQATPATWKLLIAAGWQGDARLKVLCGGEAMEPALARSLLVRCESLWNMYGPTETTIWSAALHVTDAEYETVPIGHPVQNTSFYVLDQMGQPVPQGVAGELWIGGEGLARGYLHRPDLTEERFRPCPFVADPDARMYRTGDLVRYREDGTLDFYGRLDHQVKLRGFRIELGEIENTLRTCNGILDAVTMVREDGGEKRLVAYLTFSGNQPPAQTAVRDKVRETLPEYMVPAAYVFLREFPRLPNGKLDRSSLPAPQASQEGNQGTAFQAPITGLQQTVAQVFRKVLAIDHVGLDDNWFDLGAHSLQMVRAHAELNQSIGTPIPLVSFFQYPNIRTLCAHIEQSGGALVAAARGN